MMRPSPSLKIWIAVLLEYTVGLEYYYITGIRRHHTDAIQHLAADPDMVMDWVHLYGLVVLGWLGS